MVLLDRATGFHESHYHRSEIWCGFEIETNGAIKIAAVKAATALDMDEDANAREVMLISSFCDVKRPHLCGERIVELFFFLSLRQLYFWLSFSVFLYTSKYFVFFSSLFSSSSTHQTSGFFSFSSASNFWIFLSFSSLCCNRIPCLIFIFSAYSAIEKSEFACVCKAHFIIWFLRSSFEKRLQNVFSLGNCKECHCKDACTWKQILLVCVCVCVWRSTSPKIAWKVQ